MKKDRATESMKEQLKKGYLKLAILYTLLNEPAHGYKILKKIREGTLGLISPTAGSLYPALRDLEGKGLIEGEWHSGGRRLKVYRITEEGKKIFKDIVEGHLNLVSTIRRWLLNKLNQIHPIEDLDNSSSLVSHAIKILLSGGEVSQKDKIEFLRDLREFLKRTDDFINNLIASIDKRLMELEASS